ncbi:hypothetical protein DN069_13690 [Streptacidiphilus pinicola]|uniref:Alpha/beta hydrolase n=1 Tax=Streptacidiphilus pinicola TaxID=2219663 RepID=A0A2X0IP51_9ACTN|nr:hypothetical protein [Streptacidiphilus pinicola]RAG85011.1 hypothetical protein DN069_13690 [Streptacidiphilus pinicola]
MSEDLVQPLPGFAAFSEPAVTETPSVSQALQMIYIGAQLSGHRYLLEPDGLRGASVVGELEVPVVAELGTRVISMPECAEYVARRLGADPGIVTGLSAGTYQHAGVRADLWQVLRAGQDLESDRQVAAVALLRVALQSTTEHQLLRVVAASELTWLQSEGSQRRSERTGAEPAISNTLDLGLTSNSEDIRLVADNALTGIRQARESSAAQPSADAAETEEEEEQESATSAEGEEPASGGNSLIVHGTWANKGKTKEWWRPSSGAFHTYLSGHPLGTGLYAGDQPFEWSGDFDDYQREVAGKALRWWMDSECGATNLNAAFAHSHGGTVLQWAVAHRDLRLGLMVALACPDYRWSNAESRSIAQRVGVVVSVRARHDPVLLADRCRHFLRRRSKAFKGAYDLPLKGAGHSDVHDAALWGKHNVADKVLNAAAGLGWSP